MTNPVFQRTSASFAYYQNDHLGTPQRLIDKQGITVWQASYDAFGKASININTVENNLRFAGQYFDSESNLHQNWNRDYDPETGRYLQRDPVGLRGGINNYAYVMGDPVMGMDPWGLKTLCEALMELRDGSADVPDWLHNPFLNKNIPFNNEYKFGREPVPRGGDPIPGTDDRNAFAHDDGKKYDIQYIQAGWWLHNHGGSLVTWTVYPVWLYFATVMDGANGISLYDPNWVNNPDNFYPNKNGLSLGNKGASNYDNFPDFVKSICEGCNGWKE